MPTPQRRTVRRHHTRRRASTVSCPPHRFVARLQASRQAISVHLTQKSAVLGLEPETNGLTPHRSRWLPINPVFFVHQPITLLVSHSRLPNSRCLSIINDEKRRADRVRYGGRRTLAATVQHHTSPLAGSHRTNVEHNLRPGEGTVHCGAKGIRTPYRTWARGP